MDGIKSSILDLIVNIHGNHVI